MLKRKDKYAEWFLLRFELLHFAFYKSCCFLSLLPDSVCSCTNRQTAALSSRQRFDAFFKGICLHFVSSSSGIYCLQMRRTTEGQRGRWLRNGNIQRMDALKSVFENLIASAEQKEPRFVSRGIIFSDWS